MHELLKALILGVVEGVTEFIPVSSTGHLIIAGHWLGFEGDFETLFEIFIQLGAILAIVWLYRAKLFGALFNAAPLKVSSEEHWRSQPAARRLIVNLIVAFIPAAAVGFLIHHWIEDHLFSTATVAGALLVGGVGILAVEKWKPAARVATVDDIPTRSALGVGLAQVLSLFPGVSRSAATIMGGMAIGLSREAATEFSFFVAVPIMFAATLFELVSKRALLSGANVPVLAVGFVTAFLSAAVVVKAFVRYVAGHSFAVFAWYRILLGALLLVLLYFLPR